jgi:hypothetical protein
MNRTLGLTLRQSLQAARPTLGGLGYGIAAEWDDDGPRDRDLPRPAVPLKARRRADFLTGRRALGRALADTGISELTRSVLIGQRGRPSLPTGLTASISHSHGIAVALAASTERFRSVGIDLELGGLPDEAAHLLLTEPERAWLSNVDSPAERRYRLLTAFSAKETAFKALDPLFDAGNLRRIHLIPLRDGFMAWPAGRPRTRLKVRVHPIGTGVLTWTVHTAGTTV